MTDAEQLTTNGWVPLASLEAPAAGLASVVTHLDSPDHHTTPTLTLVIPTRNEAHGVETLLGRLAGALTEPTEIIFVDDSDDATPWQVRRLVESQTWGNLTVKLVHRTNMERAGGLGSAVCEGIRRATADWVCVMDADLQHPPELIPELLGAAQDRSSDVVIASRFLDESELVGLSSRRRRVSRVLASTIRSTLQSGVKDITDPLSGFFVLRRNAVDPDLLRPNGFKILMEILGRYPDLRVSELGFTFAERHADLSKASMREGVRFMRHLGRLRVDRMIHATPKPKKFRYDVHGLITVESHGRLPELEKFRVASLTAPPTIRIERGRFEDGAAGELIDLRDATPRIRYQESLGHRGFAIEVEVGETTRIWVSDMITNSPHVMYTNVVEPILRWKFVEMGYALVHAACFTDEQGAHFVTARTDTGKTTTMLKILELGDYKFISDDLTLVNAEGTVFTYPKPLTISNHTVHALRETELDRRERFFLPVQSRLHSRSGRHFAMFLAEKNIPVASLNSFVQRVIPPPKYHVERLVPKAGTADRAEIATLNIIQRGEENTVNELEIDNALSILLENCEDAYGFPPYHVLETLLHTCASGDDLRFVEREIIAAGLGNVKARLFTSPNMSWAEDIHQTVLAGETAFAVDDSGG